MSDPKSQAHFALALLAATSLSPVAPAGAAPGDALGPAFLVNTSTTSWQIAPSVAMDADGDFVVVWTGTGSDASYGLFAQLYDPTGAARGPEFQIHTTMNSEFAVAMDADGDFVVAWQRMEQDGSGWGILARRFDAAGVAQGPAFQVNTYTEGSQWFPAVAMDTDGDFVVAWESSGQDGNDGGSGVFAQRHSAAGVAQVPEFQVNSITTGSQYRPAVAIDADGDFVVAWCSDKLTDRSGPDVFAQRFDATGKAQGAEFQVNSFMSGFEQSPTVAMDADGDFVVAWQMGTGIFARRFDAAGLAQGPEFRVDSSTARSRWLPTVAMDADGDFVVAWESFDQDGDNYGVFARRYDATGAAQGPEFQVNTATTGAQRHPAVAMDADGDFVVAWEDVQEGGYEDIHAQRFQGAERVAGDFDGDGNADLLWRNTATGAAVVWLMDGETRLDEGPIGNVSLNWRIAGTGDFNGDGKADILWRHSANGNAVVWQMNGLERSAFQSIGKPSLAWVVEQVRDTDGDGLSDIVWRHTGSGKTRVWRMNGFTKVSAEPVGRVSADWQLK